MDREFNWRVAQEKDTQLLPTANHRKHKLFHVAVLANISNTGDTSSGVQNVKQVIFYKPRHMTYDITFISEQLFKFLGCLR